MAFTLSPGPDEAVFLDNLERIRSAIAAAAAKAGRAADEVSLLAVTKNFDVPALELACRSGLRLFGENRVQEAQYKMPQLPGDISWRLIGHLQTNKAGLAARLFDAVDSVDSEKLLAALDRHADEAGKRLEIMLEVNIADEPQKSGVAIRDLPALADAARASRNLDLTGLLCIPPAVEDPEEVRPYFARLRELAEELSLPKLSMGMSGDYAVAVEEGATMVRIGTALFGHRR
jgi:hypothetical protein